MKLSDIKGERTIDVIADIIDPIANIAADKENTAGLFEKVKPPSGLSEAEIREFAKEKLVERARKFAPPLLKNHKRDILTIFALIEGVDIEEYTDTLTLPKLIMGLVELLTDEVFRELFISAQSGTGDISSPSARENIKAAEA